MKIKSIKATIHRIHAEVPLLKHPLSRRIVFCEVETDETKPMYYGTKDALLEACLRTPPLLRRSLTALARIVIGWDLQLAPWQLTREALQGIEPGDLVRVPLQRTDGGRFAARLVPHRAGLCGDARAGRAFHVEAAIERGGWIRLYLPSTNPATHTMDDSTPLEALTVPIVLQLPLVAMSLGDIEAARPGTLVDTGVRLEDVEVGLCSAGQHFASGRLVLVGEHLGVEVTRLVGSER